jgi:hypothetical protein
MIPSILTHNLYAKCHIIFGMLSVIMLNVVMLCVMAPLCTLILKLCQIVYNKMSVTSNKQVKNFNLILELRVRSISSPGVVREP